MEPVFNQDFFVGNRQRLRQAYEGGAPIVVTANGLLQRNGDSSFGFRQDSSFWYLTGIDEPDVLLVMDAKREYLIVPGRDAVRQAFDGSVDISALASVSGIPAVLDETAGWEQLRRSLQTGRVATPLALPGYIEHDGMYSNPARARLAKRLKTLKPGLQFDDIRPQLARLRMIKQAVELQALRRAIAVTAEGLQAVTAPKALAKYNYEYEIEADLSRHFRRGAQGHAFTPIVAAGPRACQLHYVSNGHRIEPDGLIVLDVGAEYQHYAADISRTVVYGLASQRQRQVYEAVLDVQAYALSLLRPGADYRDYEKAVRQYMAQTLQKLGLTKDADTQSTRQYYPHATSHFLGLDVHDVGDYRQPLQPGTVVTCEPGIYIPQEGIGVRIEDDILITDDGYENLSQAIPRGLV